jgi:hypothetical protein
VSLLLTAVFQYSSPAAGAAVTVGAPIWTEVSSHSSPAPATDAALAYDGATGQLVATGGSLFDAYTYVWNGSTWQQATTNPSPQLGYSGSMAYDAATGQLLLFGFFEIGNGPIETQTWSWSGSTWTMLSPSNSPSPRFLPAMAYDPLTKQVVLFGGLNGHAGYDDDTWVWNGTSWMQKSPAASPPAFDSVEMGYDTATKQLILVGLPANTPANAPVTANEASTWAWTGSTWVELSSQPCCSIDSPGEMSYDPAANGLVLLASVADQTEVYVWDGTSWKEENTSPLPPARTEASMAYDAMTSQLVLVGGLEAGNPLDDTWVSGSASESTPSTGSSPYVAIRGPVSLFKTSDGRDIALRLTCSGARCGGVARITRSSRATVVIKVKGGTRRVHRTVVKTLGGTRFSLKAGATEVVLARSISTDARCWTKPLRRTHSAQRWLQSCRVVTRRQRILH